MTVTRTICCYCGTGCGIEITTDRRGRKTLRGDPEHPANRGHLCSKGRSLLHTALARAERLTVPQVRLDRAHPLRPSTWDAALAHVAATFRRIIATHGPDAVAFYGSGQLLTEEYYVLNKLVKGFIGTNNIDTNSRLCMSSAVAGYKQTLGADGPPTLYEDIEACDTFLIAGANPAWCHPIIWQRIEARRLADPDVRIVVVDPRRTASCASADLHLQIIPGTDVALHYGLARQLIALGAIDETFIAAHVTGWQEFTAACAPFTLDATARICGVTEAELVQVAAWLAGDRRFLSLWTMGLNQSSSGVDKNVTLIALSLITGKIGRAGCGPFSLTGQPNAMGGREVGGMANLGSNHRELSDLAHRAETARFWGVDAVPERPGLTAVELFAALRTGAVKAVWIIATNPVESLPDAGSVDEALALAELVVVQDIYPTATSRHAHVLLPAATWLEKTGTMTNAERRIALLDSALEPPGQALPDRVILQRFAAHMGWQRHFAWEDDAAVFAEHARLSQGRDCDISGLSHALLRKRGPCLWPAPDAAAAGSTVRRLYGDGRFAFADGRARLRAPASVSRHEATSAAWPLILITGRLRDQWHTMTRTGRVAKLRSHAPVPVLDMHPDDARARGLAEGDMVRVSGERGMVQVQVALTDSVRPGVVFLPMHWGRQHGGVDGRTNNMTSPRFDPVSKEPDLKYAAVEVVRVTPPVRDILLVGGGAAARSFIAAHAAAGLMDRITVLGDEPEAMYNRVLLPHYVAGANAWPDMVTATPADLAAQRVVFRPGVRVAAIDRVAKSVVDAEGTRHPYGYLVLCTGSRAARHHQGRLPANGVHFLRRRSDADAIRDQAGPGRRAVVVGGGLLGLELADALNTLGCTVTILQRSERLMGRQLDATAAALLAETLQERGVTIRFRCEVEELVGTVRLQAVRLADTGKTELPADLLVFATGTAPNAELARVAGLDCSTGVIVDRYFQTSDPAIAAIGEVAEFEGRAAGTTAAVEEQSRLLVEWLRGNHAEAYRGPLNANLLKVQGVRLAAVGETDPAAGTAEIVSFHDPALGIYQKCVIRDDRLIGAILWGDTTAFPAFRDLIASGIELEDRRATLLRGGAVPVQVQGRLVCSCNQVGETTIRAAIAQGCRDLATVCRTSGAGTACGSCRSDIARLLTPAAAVA